MLEKVGFIRLLIFMLIWLTGCEKVPHLPPQINLLNSYGPYFIKTSIDSGVVNFITHERLLIASARWETAIDGAKNAKRPIPILHNIQAKKTALLVIDMQRAFLDSGAAIEVPEGRTIVSSINKLANALRKEGALVVWFRYIVNEQEGLLKHFESESYLGGNRESPMKALRPGHPQFELYPELDVQKNDIIMDKIRYSAVLGSHIVDTLAKYGIENVIVTGVTTDVCAGNTAEDLMQKDFHVIMVWDGTAALDRLEHELYLARIFGLYGDVMPTEEILQRLK